MFQLKALFRRWVAVASVAGLAIALGCQGPDEFFRRADAGQPGAGGASSPGTAGTTGTAGSAAGTGGGPTGTAGVGGSGTGNSTGTGNTTGSGGSIGGTAGAGPGTGGASSPGSGGAVSPAGSGGMAGSATGRGGAAGTGGASSPGTAGATGTGGRAGATGTAGGGGSSAGSSGTGRGGSGGTTTGTGGATGVAGTTGSGGSGTGTGGSGTGTGGSGTGGAPMAGRIQVQAQCQSNNDMQNIRVTFRILNPESTAKQLSDIKVRYYFTLTMPLTPMVNFDYVMKYPSSMLTATATDTYVEVGFAAGTGTLAAFDNVTGTDQIQLRIYNFSSTTWNASSDDDYSYKSCTGAASSTFTDRTTMPGYYQGQLAWGTEPPGP
jgi:hypothetical protein